MGSSSLGLVGLGRMGLSIAQRLIGAGHSVVVYDKDPSAVQAAVELGAVGSADLAGLPAALERPRIIWLMVPAGEAVDQTVAGLLPQLSPGDTLIDGGNSHYLDSVRRAEALRERQVAFLDSGTSGGLEGARTGLCLMVGGEPAAFAAARPLLQALAQPEGCLHVGPSGAGHYAKMVHNAIEYGMMQAIGEGFELLESAPYPYEHAAIARLWNRGSVVRSWLVELAERAFAAEPHLEGITGEVGGGSTGSWAVEEGWRRGVTMGAIATAYMLRLRSRQADTFSGKVVAALRREFGGHSTRRASQDSDQGK